MNLSKLLDAIGYSYKDNDCEISFITDDSRKCKENCIFVCHNGTSEYIEEAKEKGSAAIITNQKVTAETIIVENTRECYAKLCSAYFGDIHKKLKLIAVTGTNGKTSVAVLVHRIIELTKGKCGLIGTLGSKIGDEDAESSLTTPDAFEIHKIFSALYESGGEYCVIEASSQGLSQKRLFGLEFEVAVFTNLTADHLDYHGTMENYKSSKLKLFSQCKTAIINYDDSYAKDFIQATKGKVITYSVKSDEADFTARNIIYSEDSTDYIISANSLIQRIRLKLLGVFNVYNSMAAIISSMEIGCDLFSCAAALKTFSGIKGRFEILNIDAPFKVIIDYAHTPDGLKQVLLSIGSFKKGRIITVFGCGGDRDKSKRHEMGRVVSSLSDIMVITSDNPRNELPENIIDDILEGVTKKGKSVYIHENRTKAIEYALKIAVKNDIILLAGKGHEDYMIIGNDKIPYDEREIVKASLSKSADRLSK